MASGCLLVCNQEPVYKRLKYIGGKELVDHHTVFPLA